MNVPNVVRPTESESSTRREKQLQWKPDPKRAVLVLLLLLLPMTVVALATTNDKALICDLAIIAMVDSNYPSLSSGGEVPQGFPVP